MISRKVEIDEALIVRVKQMHAEGLCVSDLIAYLAGINTPKPYTMIALRRAGVLSLGDAKLQVHYHPAYADRRAYDEEFQDAAFAAWEELKRQQRTSSAAA